MPFCASFSEEIPACQLFTFILEEKKILDLAFSEIVRISLSLVKSEVYFSCVGGQLYSDYRTHLFNISVPLQHFTP